MMAKRSNSLIRGGNPDLLTIKEAYLDRGDMFWCGIDENDRVVGCIGCSRIPDTTEAFK